MYRGTVMSIQHHTDVLCTPPLLSVDQHMEQLSSYTGNEEQLAAVEHFINNEY